MASLLERALKINQNARWNDNITSEHIELAIAWAQGKVGMSQMMRALDHKTTTTVYTLMAHALREAVRSGKLQAK